MPALAEIFEELVAAASQAPSPDNNQPWHFRLADEATIEVFHCAERALRSDVEGMFDHLSIGAAIENLSLRAAQRGWHVTARSPASRSPTSSRVSAPLAVLHCERNEPLSSSNTDNQLAASIASRQTNRLPYSQQAITAETAEQICNQASSLPGCRLAWIDDRSTITELARTYAAADKIRFEQRSAHAELYSQLHFHANPHDAHGSGLDVRTLELPWGAASVLWQLRRWWLMQCVNRLGLTRLLIAPMQKLTQQSAALGILIVKRGLSENEAPFLTGGRAMQRSWLMAQALGIAVHPLGSVPLFLQLLHSPSSPLTAIQSKTLEGIESLWKRRLGLADSESCLLGLRFGYAPQPRYRNPRLPTQTVMTS